MLLGPGAFLPRPEDRRQPPFLDQLYTSNGGCSTSMCHWVVAGVSSQWICGEEAGWPAAPPSGWWRSRPPPLYSCAMSRSRAAANRCHYARFSFCSAPALSRIMDLKHLARRAHRSRSLEKAQRCLLSPPLLIAV
ncbi:unnamed protein product [Danaus chrysippus]|uniref:(African queen) hypothetical protein n=1 Tax=Danaus chrysippus TaxID=151541 RepID=A0A8J2Q0F1_9NEOP|nr:unnamed protein product [Danaus chrysippus]